MSAVLNNLGTIRLQDGDFAAARRYYEESLATRRRLNDYNLPTSINNLANLALMQGDLATAQALLDEGIPIAERLGATRNLNSLLTNRGFLALERGDAAAATTQLRMVLEDQQAANNPAEQINALQNLGYIALVDQRLAQAEVWLRQAATLCSALGMSRYTVEVALQRSRLAIAQGDDAAAWTLVQDTIRLALAGVERRLLPEVAEQAALLLLRQGAREPAIDLWRTAAALRRTAGIPQLPSLLRWYGDQTAALVTGSVSRPPAGPDNLPSMLGVLVDPAAGPAPGSAVR